MRRLFLHIGMPRTATTSLQALLTRAAGTGGIAYPNLYKDAEGLGHHELIGAILQDPKAVALQVDSLDSDVLLSAESLFNALIGSSRLVFGEFLEEVDRCGFETTIICGVRPISELSWSLYLQTIRAGEFFQDYRGYFGSAALGVTQSLLALSELAATRKVEVLKYSGHIIEDFVKLVFADAASEVLAKDDGKRLSLSPSLLLHSYYLWRSRSGLPALSNRLHWWLIGRDMEGGLFPNDTEFAEIGADELRSSLESCRGELDNFRSDDWRALAEYLLQPTDHSAYDLRVRTTPVDLQVALQTLGTRDDVDRGVLDEVAATFEQFATDVVSSR